MSTLCWTSLCDAQLSCNAGRQHIIVVLSKPVLLLQSSHQGWLAQHVLLWEPVGGQLMGCVPLYLKTHSYGTLFCPSFLAQLSLPSSLSAAVPAACLSLQACMCLHSPAFQMWPMPAWLLLLNSCPCTRMHLGDALLPPERFRAAVQGNMFSITPGQTCMPGWVSSTTPSCRAACPSRLCRGIASSSAQVPSRLRCGKL